MHAKALPVDRIMAIFERRLGILVPAPDTDLFDAGLLDSLSFINLLLHLESEFGISVPLEKLDLEQFGSVHRIAAFVADAADDAASFDTHLVTSAG